MKNEPRTIHPRKENAPSRSGRCIALIDSNYMAWLLRQSTDAPAEPETYNRIALIPSLAQALKGAGLALDVQRVYWYTDTPDTQFPQDQIVRHLEGAGAEPGDVVFQAMSADIARLAENQACEHLLIASDDDRLTPVIDEAQLRIENRIEFAVNTAGEIAVVAAFDVAATHDAADLIGLFEGPFDMLGKGEGDGVQVFLRPRGGLLLRFVGHKIITEGDDDDGDGREQSLEVGG
jgi:hypothetical protein